MKSSIQSRLVFSASVVLFCFLGLAGFVLDTAYQKGAQNALNDRLQIHLYSILATAELSKNSRLMMPSGLSEPKFSQIDSGLYAYIFNNDGTVVWRSSSSAGESITPVKNLSPGEKTFLNNRLDQVSNVELHYKAILESPFGQSSAFEFVVIESTQSVDSQVAGFRSVLWQWLGGISLLLIIIQFWIIRVSLQPLRHIVSDLEKIQQGDAQHLANHYSEELKDIANTLNRLIDNERTHLKRYRNTLADLAHSLKTPLSVLTGLYGQNNLSTDDIKTLESQTLQMRQLVDYQLQKAAAKGHQTLAAPLHVKPVIQQITTSLDKVYLEKQLSIVSSVDASIKFNAEKGDMFELFGNLLDNAYKWAKSSVNISVQILTNKEGEALGIQIIIEDDGPGIPLDKLDSVLQRGIRADETTKGHGIGLAVVNELVSLYKGTLESTSSDLGGQRWVIILPK
ncbi:ATP-binding protein [Cycloclasticus sp. 44_32_T64]|nr:ATP-binding protein [Cycloclasticus sp. 44_32_T64]